MARSKLPAKSVFQDSGFKFRRIGNSKLQFSIAPRMPADDDHDYWWYAPQKRVTLEKPDDKAALLALAESYRWELTHPEEVAAQRAAEEAGRLTVGAYVERWRSMRQDAVIRGDITDATAERDEVELRRIEKYLGDVALADVTREIIEDAYTTMASDGVSQYTRSRTHTKLKAVLDQARLDGLISTNPAMDVSKTAKPKAPKPDKGRQDERRVTSKEADELAANILAEDPDGLRVAVWLARTTGMRRGEILGLLWDDIDFDEEVIHIRRAQGKKGVQSTKTYESMRDLPVAKPVWTYLKRWQECQKEQFKNGLRVRDENNKLVRGKGPVRLAGDGKPGCDEKGWMLKRKRWSESTPVCTNTDGNAWDVNNFNRSLRIYFASHGLGEFTERIEFKSSRKNADGTPMVQTRKTGYVGASLHSLRHTYATELVAAKVDVKTAQALLGHTNVQTTLQLYADAVEENMRAAVTLHAMHVATEQDVGVYSAEDMLAYEAFAKEELHGEGE